MSSFAANGQRYPAHVNAIRGGWPVESASHVIIDRADASRIGILPDILGHADLGLLCTVVDYTKHPAMDFVAIEPHCPQSNDMSPVRVSACKTMP